MEDREQNHKRPGYLTNSHSQNPLNGLGSTHSSSDKIQRLKNGILNQNSESKEEVEGCKVTKINKKLPDTFNSKLNIPKILQNHKVHDTVKKRLKKIIDTHFETNKTQFSNAAWAYLDMENNDKQEEKGLYCLRLLFGPENLKRELFHKINKKNKKNQQKLKKCIKINNENQPHTENNFKTTGCTREDDIGYQMETGLRNMCKSFFQKHGLVAKVRRLPLEFDPCNNLPNRRTPRPPSNPSSYPSYHFISRQKRHLIEQVMRSRNYLQTDYNTFNDTRNFRSPFSLFAPHSNLLSYLQDIKSDLNDRDFSGLFISLSTSPFKSKTQLGSIRRTKLVAWCIVEILTNNERCLKCLWVNPLISANGTTDLLRAFLPFTMLTSLTFKVPNIESPEGKLFYAWLTDFDLFPRQTLVLLTSPYRFGLEKHFDDSQQSHTHSCSTVLQHYSKYLYENNISDYISPRYNFTTSDEDELYQEEVDEYMDSTFKLYLHEYLPYMLKENKKCKCYEKANWNELDRIMLACSEQAMVDAIPRWMHLIKRTTSSYLEEDIENIIAQRPNELESSYEIRTAEFTNLENNHIQDLLVNLYGNRWTIRLKVKYIKIFKAEELNGKLTLSPSEGDHRQNRRLSL